MKKLLKLGVSAALVSLFAFFVGNKLDDQVRKDRFDSHKDRGVDKI